MFWVLSKIRFVLYGLFLLRDKYPVPNTLRISGICVVNAFSPLYNERIPYGYNICLAWNKKPDEVDAERFLPFTEVTYSHFHQGCLMAGCLNGGSCLFDEGKDAFACSCNPQWRGETCHMGKVLVLTYTFLLLNINIGE